MMAPPGLPVPRPAYEYKPLSVSPSTGPPPPAPAPPTNTTAGTVGLPLTKPVAEVPGFPDGQYLVGPPLYRSFPVFPQSYESHVAANRQKIWAQSAAGKRAKADADAAAEANKKKADLDAAKLKAEATAKNNAAQVAAAGWNTLYFSGGEDTRQTIIRAGFNGVNCDVGEWKWVGEPGNGGFRICEVRYKKDVKVPTGSELVTPGLAYHLMQGVSGPPSWGYGPGHGKFQPPQPTGPVGAPRYAGGAGYAANHQSYMQTPGQYPYGYSCECHDCMYHNLYQQAHHQEHCIHNHPTHHGHYYH